MKATPNLDFTHVKFEKTSFHHFVQMIKNVYQNLIGVINGRVGFGDGTLPDNIDGSWINVVAPVAPNTDFTVNHNLQRLPVGYWVMQKDRACDIYTGSVAATTTQLTLRATAASAVLRLFIIAILLSLFSISSFGQGAGHRDFAFVAANTSAGSGVVKVIPSAVVTVCNGALLPPAGSVCTGTANIFSDVALTLPLSNPTNADARGNYVFFATAGQNYVVSVGGVGVITYSYIWVAPIVSLAGSGTITSISSSSISPLFNVNIATSTTTPAFSYSPISQNANTFYAGPSGTATDLVDFAISTATGTASPISISATPKQSGDFAMVFSVRDNTGNAPAFTPDVSWTASSLNSSTQEYFYKNVIGTATAAASGPIGNTGPNWSAALALFTARPTFTPTLTNQSNILTGAFSSFTNQVIGFVPTAGRTLIIAIMSGFTSNNLGPVSVVSFTDSVGDVFVPVSQVINNAGQGTEIILLAATNITGGATTFSGSLTSPTCGGCGISNGIASVFEVTNLAPVTPTFGPMTVRYVVGADLPHPTPVSVGAIFSKAAVANQFLTSVNVDGTIGAAQPSFANLTGVATGAQLPATTSNCTGNNFAQGLNSGFTPICVAASTPAAVRLFTNQNLAGDVAVGANSLATIDSVAVTMPSSGGPWRANVVYNYFISGGVNGECTLSDGTTSWAQMETQPLNNIGSCQDSAWSKTTYANGAVVTFTVNIWDTGAITVKATSNFHTAVASYIQVAILSTN